MSEQQKSVHTISVYVSNKPGVLARVAQVFARRGYNIDSLVVSASTDGHFSRMTITAQGAAGGLGQIIAQVDKLVDVLHCTDHSDASVVVREMALVKLAVGDAERTAALQVCDHFACKTVDLTSTSIIAMVTGNSEKVDAAVAMLGTFKIVEIVRTGKVVMARGENVT